MSTSSEDDTVSEVPSESHFRPSRSSTPIPVLNNKELTMSDSATGPLKRKLSVADYKLRAEEKAASREEGEVSDSSSSSSGEELTILSGGEESVIVLSSDGDSDDDDIQFVDEGPPAAKRARRHYPLDDLL